MQDVPSSIGALKKLNRDVKDTFESGQEAVDDATKNLNKEKIDEVIRDVEKKMKERSGK